MALMTPFIMEHNLEATANLQKYEIYQGYGGHGYHGQNNYGGGRGGYGHGGYGSRGGHHTSSRVDDGMTKDDFFKEEKMNEFLRNKQHEQKRKE